MGCILMFHFETGEQMTQFRPGIVQYEAKKGSPVHGASRVYAGSGEGPQPNGV